MLILTKHILVRHVLLLLAISQFVQKGQAQERIIFSSDRNSNSDIFMMDGTGGNLVQLTSTTTDEWAPTWLSEDVITFLRQEKAGITRYKLDLSNGKESPLKQPLNCVLDDKNMLYLNNSSHGIYSCNGDIFLSDTSGNILKNLTEEFSGLSRYVSWTSEDYLTFTNNSTGNNDVYLLNLKTGHLKNLTNNLANDERGELSPDGNYLVFSSNQMSGNIQEILMLNLSNGTIKNISQSKGTALIARWSRDGERIYYGSNKDGDWEIYAYNMSTEETTQLTTNDNFDGDPRVR